MPTQTEAKEFFFEAMLEAYNNRNRLVINDLAPGWHFVPAYNKGLFSSGWMASRREDNEFTRFMGDHIICYDKIPIWVSRWEGWYMTLSKDKVGEISLRAKKKAWEARKFFATGGPKVFVWGGLTYKNALKENLFTKFSGEQTISFGEDLLAWQRTWGEAWEIRL